MLKNVLITCTANAGRWSILWQAKKCLGRHALWCKEDEALVHDPFIYLEHSCDIAGAEDPLHAGVSMGIRCREVGGEDAVLVALPALVLARGAPLARAAGGGFRVCALRHDLAQDLAERERRFARFCRERERRFAGRFWGSCKDMLGAGKDVAFYVYKHGVSVYGSLQRLNSMPAKRRNMGSDNGSPLPCMESQKGELLLPKRCIGMGTPKIKQHILHHTSISCRY